MSMENRMTAEREAAILNRAICTYGTKVQVIIAIEEMSELQQALSKWIRMQSSGEYAERKERILEAVREEMADVGIMLNQLELIFGDCTEQEIAKLERLERRLAGERKG